MKVLLVDDDLLTLEWVTFFLRSNNIEIRTADSISAARQSLEDWRPDLIVSDLSLKDDTAYSFLSGLQIGETNLNIPVIIVSGHTLDAGERERFQGYLMKPVEPDELLDLIRRFLPQ